MYDYYLGIDPVTLRERVDLVAAEQRLEDIGPERSLTALNERATLLRFLGRLDEAMDVANEAVRQARFGADRERLTRARIRHALVVQFSGKHEAALVELSDCVNEAEKHGWSDCEAFALQHRAKVYFELGRNDEAAQDLSDALIIRIRERAPADQIDSTMMAIGTVIAARDAASPPPPPKPSILPVATPEASGDGGDA